jgi:hypothetical protein
MHEWVKNMQLTFALDLDEWVKIALLEFRLRESHSQVVTFFVKA